MGGFGANRLAYNGFYYKPVSLGVGNIKNGLAMEYGNDYGYGNGNGKSH
jgi:hypothetical protein